MRTTATSAVPFEAVWVDHTLMTIEASDEVRSLVRERGGLLYLWVTAHGYNRARICLLEAATARPSRRGLCFHRTHAREFDLLLDLKGWTAPKRLVLEAHGRRGKIRAFWNGLAYVE
jgi:hypothetical protein